MMTPDYLLGLQLATASDDVLQVTLSERPYTLALLRHLNEIAPGPHHPSGLDDFLNPVQKMNPNERRLSRITAPPATTRHRRRTTRSRLRRMQEELSGRNIPTSASAHEIENKRGTNE